MLAARDIHAVQIAVAEESSTASKHGPSSFPATLWGGIKSSLMDNRSSARFRLVTFFDSFLSRHFGQGVGGGAVEAQAVRRA